MSNPSDTSGRRAAMLLLGPTGAGKTPLGDVIERRGLWGRRCVHFDFGANLRRVVDHGPPSCLSKPDVDVIVRVLRSGALLEDGEFHIALGILTDFMRSRGVGDEDIVILNGLPRHAGQAAGLERVVDIRKVICLECPASVVIERIRTDSGGDRAGRTDDSAGEVARKLELYRTRTQSLVDYYLRTGTVAVQRIEVGVQTTALELWACIRAHEW